MVQKFYQLVKVSSYSHMKFQPLQRISCQRRNYGSQSSYALPEGIHSTTFNIGSYNIRTVKAGHGPQAIFCLPGILGSVEVQLMDQISRFDKNKFTVYSWDQAGYGYSRPPERDFYDGSLKEDADLLACVLKELGHEKYSIMGWSGGGLSALLTAIDYPELVENLVVWGCFAKTEPRDVETFKFFRNPSNWGGRMKEVLVDYYGLEFFEKHWETWMTLFIRIYTHGGGEFCSKKLHQIKCPTFIIHGDQDALIHPSHANFLHENIKDSKLLIWKKGKHNVHLRYPQEFNEIVQDFLLRSNSNSDSAAL